MKPRLARSTTDCMVAGVCGGLGTYLRIDPVFVRLFFVLLTLGGGSGVLVYLILWIVIPSAEQGQVGSPETMRSGAADEIADRARTLGEELRSGAVANNPRAGLIIGAGLLLLGLVFLVQNLQIGWLRWLDMSVLWPILLIAGGILLIWRRLKGATV